MRPGGWSPNRSLLRSTSPSPRASPRTPTWPPPDVAFVVIDDHLLRDVLVGGGSRRVRAARRRGELATTGLYHHRLCASFAREPQMGRLSAPFASVQGV